MAQALTHQFDPAAQNPVITLLLRLVDLVCTMQDKSPVTTTPKLRELRSLLDQLDERVFTGKVSIPVKRHASTSATISTHTAAVIKPSVDGHEFDEIIVSVPDRQDIYGVV